MSNEEQQASDNKATVVPLRYAGQSEMVADDGGSRLALFGNLQRDPVQLEGTVQDPLLLRESLSVLHAIVSSDYRYVPKDRTAYQAYRRMRSESANLNAWQAQHAYYDWLARNDPLAFLILDPVITVHPDRLLLEVFSKDEGSYASLGIAMDSLELSKDPVFGTTNIDFSEGLFASIQRFRSYRATQLTIGQEAVAVETDEVGNTLEKKISVPDSWIRGFLQVQSASMLPAEVFSIAPIDLYNALRHLRMKADQRGKKRGLRFELVPNERPRIVLEPWEQVIETHAEPYDGPIAKVVRVWGRRRLMMMRRLLPYVEEMEIRVLGSGLPSFWVFRAGAATLTLGLTGFTASNWSQALNFDLMLPRSGDESAGIAKVVKALAKTWSATREQLEKSTKLKGEALSEALQGSCQQGQVMYDVADNVYRLRPLTDTPLEMERLQFRSENERRAYDLVHRKGAVSITGENRVHGKGLELTGKVVVDEDKREYRPQLLLNDEGFVDRAECTCNAFRKQGLKEGPCTCLIALRLSHAIREKELREGGRKRRVSVETRSYSRRTEGEEHVYTLTLNRQLLRIRWGVAGHDPRSQQLHFATVDEAREEYLERVQQLEEAGYLDASAS